MKSITGTSLSDGVYSTNHVIFYTRSCIVYRRGTGMFYNPKRRVENCLMLEGRYTGIIPLELSEYGWSNIKNISKHYSTKQLLNYKRLIKLSVG